jgi:hypothetical protein
MFKKKPKPAAPAAAPADAAAPRPRHSKLKLALMVLLPMLLLGGGGAGAWFFLLVPAPEAHAEADHAEVEHGGIDPQKVAAFQAEAAAETSATYSYALAQMLKAQCGTVNVEALKEAANAEAAHDGMLVHLSWQAALRRAGTITERSCTRVLNEIDKADMTAGGAGAAEGGHGAPAGGHGAAPAAH